MQAPTAIEKGMKRSNPPRCGSSDYTPGVRVIWMTFMALHEVPAPKGERVGGLSLTPSQSNPQE